MAVAAEAYGGFGAVYEALDQALNWQRGLATRVPDNLALFGA